jgi:hypothetical protein
MFSKKFWLIALTLFSAQVFAEEKAPKVEPTPVPKAVEKLSAEKGAERVSGLYKVSRIETKPGNEVILHFESESKDGVHDLLVLKSDGLNVKIEEGQVLKLSAEVLNTSAKEHEITQVLVFLPSNDYGLSPIWLLSKAHETREIRGARYLEMHAPGSDFQVF